MVSLGRELLGGNGILADFLVAKVETPHVYIRNVLMASWLLF